MSNPKVFEYAKEIGMTPLALMDKIREWQLPVKSHMVELEPEILAVIQEKLSGGKKPAAVKVAKTTKKVAVKKTVTTAVTAKKKTVTATSAKAAADNAKVVRRKAKAEAEEEAPVVTAPEIKEEQEVVVASPPPSVATPEPPPAEVVVSSEVEPVEKKVTSRKKEVAIGASGVGSNVQQPAAAKRNIVGRMDLSRVQGMRARSAERTGGFAGPRTSGSAPASGGPRAKGNIRTGFFQAPPMNAPDLFPPEGDDFSRKKEDKKRGKVSATEGPARDAEEQPPAFDAAEYRKREMVFQPRKKKGLLARPAMSTQITTPSAHKRVVKVNHSMKVGDLAMSMGVKAPELIKVLVKNGIMATINTNLDFDTISLISGEFNFEAQNVSKSADDVLVETAFGNLEAAPRLRPPVVTVMGHVDHGKTSLLDAIRKTDVVAGEAGGITQHIGAYQVKLEDGHLITFLDTPGHEAFTAMRARGANATDIAVIVVAADDGVMPQTAEAISHAKAANVPMIIAVNKMDKPGANPDRIKQQLTEFEVVPEEWGGTTIFCPVSALKKTGVKELLEQIKLLAEVMELKANAERSGTGVVIESRLEKGRGPVATLLVQNGTVNVGQYIVAGSVGGRIRSLMNDRGERVNEAGPSAPVEVLGLDGVPQAGDRFDIVKDEKAVAEVINIRKEQVLASKQVQGKMSLEDIFAKVSRGDMKELALVLKADVAGSLEAIQGMFAKLDTDQVKIKVVHAAVGGISESDVLLASTAKGLIIGFHVRPDGGASQAAKRLGVEIRTYSIVYELIDDLKKAMSGLLAPTVVEKVMGRAEVRNIFTVPKVGVIAGCAVVDGKIIRSSQARLIRNGVIVFEGKMGSLKRFKDDAKEVASGYECGIGIENFNDIKVGDVIESFIKEEVVQDFGTLSAET